MTKTKLYSMLAAAGVSLSLSGAAQAANYITEFSFVNDGWWTAWTDSAGGNNTAPVEVTSHNFTTAGDGAGGSGLLPGGVDTLKWDGAAAGNQGTNTCATDSCLQIGNWTDGLVTVNSPISVGTAGTGTPITHFNNIIPLEDHLLSAQLTDTILLKVTMVDNAPYLGPDVFIPFTQLFDILFLETVNNGIGGVCQGFPGGGDNGVVGACQDIFVVTNPTDLTIPLLIGVPGFVDPHTYIFNISALGLGPLTDTQCSAAGAGSDCIGWITNEEQENALLPQFTVSVPEPATVALLGLGLIGMAGLRRRVKK